MPAQVEASGRTLKMPERCRLRPQGGAIVQPLDRPTLNLRIIVAGAAVLGAMAARSEALDILGVQNAALDLPRINAALRLPGETEPPPGAFRSKHWLTNIR